AIGAGLIVVDAHDRLLLFAGFGPRRLRRTIEAGGRALTSPDAFAVFVNGGLQGIDAQIADGGLRFGAFSLITSSGYEGGALGTLGRRCTRRGRARARARVWRGRGPSCRVGGGCGGVNGVRSGGTGRRCFVRRRLSLRGLSLRGG